MRSWPSLESVENPPRLRPFVLVILSDTHAHDGHELTDHLRDVVRDADRVVHAGDFTTGAVLDSFQSATSRLDAVYGNADDPAVRERLPDERVLEYAGIRIAVTHWKDGGATALSMFGRSVGADLVVFGHTHRQQVVSDAEPVLLNPGSHATPRGNRPGYATLVASEGGLAGTIREPDGAVVDRFSV